MSCTHHGQVALHWSPTGPELPDATALHLDHCDACRAVFDARFPPLHLATPRAAATRGRGMAGVLMAAAALAFVALLPPEQHERLDLGECFEELVLPPECPI